MLQGPRISRVQSWDDDILLTQTNWKNNWIASWGVKVDLDMIGHKSWESPADFDSVYKCATSVAITQSNQPGQSHADHIRVWNSISVGEQV